MHTRDTDGGHTVHGARLAAHAGHGRSGQRERTRHSRRGGEMVYVRDPILG